MAGVRRKAGEKGENGLTRPPSGSIRGLTPARPLMGVAGAGSLAQVINTAVAGKERFQNMESFFAGVGSGTKTGIWTPQIIDRHGMGEAG